MSFDKYILQGLYWNEWGSKEGGFDFFSFFFSVFLFFLKKKNKQTNKQTNQCRIINFMFFASG